MFGVLLCIFLLPLPRLSLGFLGLGSRNDSRLRTRPRAPHSELTQNRLTPKNCPLTGRMGPFSRHPTLLSSVGGKKMTWFVGNGTDVPGRVWLPFFVRSTSRYFRRSSYPWYMPFLLSPRSTGSWFYRGSSVIPCQRC